MNKLKQLIWALSKLQEALGATKGKAFSNAIIPQIYQDTSHLLYTVLKGMFVTLQFFGHVGAGGIGIILNENLGWREYSKCWYDFSDFILHCSYYRKHQLLFTY